MNAKIPLDKVSPLWYCRALMMSKDKRIDHAIELVQRADDTLGSALRMLSGLNPLAAEHIVDAQFQCDDAITHMQTRPLKRAKKKVSKRA